MHHRKITTLVRGVSQSKFQDIDRDLFYPDDSHPNGIGMFINKDAFSKYINDTYEQALKKLSVNINDQSVSNEHIVFDIGKTAILMILAQENCEGLRLIRVNNAQGSPTLIATGISSEVKNSNGRQIAKPARSGSNDKEGIMSEEVHGSSLRDIFDFIPNKNIVPPATFGDQIASLL
jgi:hypothetical protein